MQVVTEGPLGASAVAVARELGIPVVSEFHTNFHAYSRHYGFAWLENLVAAHLRRLHNRSRMTLVPSHQLGVDLARGVAALFIAAMMAMIAALGLFLREVFLAVRSGTHNQP